MELVSHKYLHFMEALGKSERVEQHDFIYEEMAAQFLK